MKMPTEPMVKKLFFKSTKNNIDLPETLSEKLDPQRGQYLRYAVPSSGSK